MGSWGCNDKSTLPSAQQFLVERNASWAYGNDMVCLVYWGLVAASFTFSILCEGCIN